MMIQENIRNELERFDKERRRDFFGMMKAFVTNKVSFTYLLSQVDNMACFTPNLSVLYIKIIETTG